MKLKEFIEKIFWIENQIQLKHWEEKSGWRHEMLGNFYKEITDKLDELVENAVGVYKDEILQISDSMYKVNNDIDLTEMMDDILNIIISFKTFFCESEGFSAKSGLINIIDDLISLINKSVYLLDRK